MSGSEAEIEVGEILGERKSRRGLEYLVRWKNFGPAEDSWEPLKNLTNAVQAIAEFRLKVPQQKKTTRKSKSRSRSRSRSRSTSRSRGRKRASPARKTSQKSVTTTTTTTIKSPTVEETKTEVVTNSPGNYEKTSETVTKTVYNPEKQQSTFVSRVSEIQASTSSSQSASPVQAKACSWMNVCCAPMRKVQDCFRGLVRSDYPAIVVFGTITIIVLSFLLEKNVDFEKVWAAISAFFIGIWTWLTTLVSKE